MINSYVREQNNIWILGRITGLNEITFVSKTNLILTNIIPSAGVLIPPAGTDVFLAGRVQTDNDILAVKLLELGQQSQRIDVLGRTFFLVKDDSFHSKTVYDAKNMLCTLLHDTSSISRLILPKEDMDPGFPVYMLAGTLRPDAAEETHYLVRKIC